MMNERIKEFRFKAAEYANELKPLGVTKWNEIRDAKFAELIVRECADISYKIAWDDLVLGEPESVIPLHIYNSIKEHFGVE
jgi:hypothetical protein